MSELRKFTSDFLKILADQTRLEILDLLKIEEKNSSEIQNELDRSQSTISKHLNMLLDNGIINFQKKENIKYYKIRNPGILELIAHIHSIVSDIYKEKFRDIRDIDVLDTLS